MIKPDNNSIRASLPPVIQKKIKRTQEKRRRETYDQSSGMIRGSKSRGQKISSPLQIAEKIISAIFRR
ncbi:MAG: hypothetical protein A4E56_00438 [Pelotomaculum sp. PtaU1.Bin065]|nr:MAG: hypothetical protein A4E56_00438 [Pelotomaculum sp. PtaU1.Bin065]